MSFLGTVIDDESQASHILNDVADTSGDTDEEWFRTLEKKEGKVLIHWWYYPDSYDAWLPESAEFVIDPEPAPEHTGAWNVSVRWLRDSFKYNEWMNEEDYEDSKTDDMDHSSSALDQAMPRESSSYHKRSKEERASTSMAEASNFPKRARTASLEPEVLPEHPNVTVMDIEMHGPKPGSRAKKNEFEPIVGGEIMNISQSVEQPHQSLQAPVAAAPPNPAPVEAAPVLPTEPIKVEAEPVAESVDVVMQETADVEKADEEMEARDETDFKGMIETPAEETANNGAPPSDPVSQGPDVPAEDQRQSPVQGDGENPQPPAEQANLDEEARQFLSEQTHEVIVPSYAAWFDMSKINDIERKSLPEFFNNKNRSKTPSVYKDYRDFMVNTYRLNPTEYLTVTACRRNLAGDVCAIIRVHAFLEQWGLINYQVRFFSSRRPFSRVFFLKTKIQIILD